MVNFSHTEIRDLSISIIVITLLFAFLFDYDSSVDLFIILIPLSFFTVGLSFVLHELAHKFTAQHYGFFAEFRRWDTGLIIAIITAIIARLVFLAPGAVYIGSYTREVTVEENGIISVAGPLVNIVLSLLFMAIGITINPYVMTAGMSYLFLLCVIGFQVNAFLAFFNLLPIPMFDGSKVFKWNKLVWIITIATSAILMYISTVISII